MEKIIKNFEVDAVIKIPFDPNDKKLKLNEAVLYSVQEFLKNKGNSQKNKFEQENNIEKMYIFLDNETQWDIVMSLNEKEIEKEKSNIIEMVYEDNKSNRRIFNDDSYTAFDKTTKDKTLSDKSSFMRDSIYVKLNSYE
jgi:hypothetical protein